MNEQNARKGGISVETEHIFPIIKRWLYSEKDIFLREIVSNATDAITKLKRLESLGEIPATDRDFAVRITVDKTAKTLTVSDNGIGMTAEELERYICNIALSGAVDFIQKYENNDDGKNGIIGHFGLGFYSAFMVSDRVEILTKSYTNAPAVHWICDESGEYEVFDCDKTDGGTDIIMHINDDEAEYLDRTRIEGIVDKYCAFMPEKIYLADADSENVASADPVNETFPIWQKSASECTDEDYLKFYHKVFRDGNDPLFWIHINADYPLNFKGILYFPKIRNEYDSIEGQVKLYYNQVFVSDNIKEVIPEYLLMLKGVLDCPELPLNVSRSYLQNNTYVSKVSAHIVKKVADKLNSIKNNDREKYETVWKGISTFIEYACLRDRKFYDRVKGSILLELTDGSFATLPEYIEDAKETNPGKIYYTTDRSLQTGYISMLEKQGIKVAVMEHIVDTQFASVLESYNSDVKFLRVDSDIAEAVKGDGEAQNNEALVELFRKVSGNESLSVSFQILKDGKIPAILNISEESRRLEEMMRLYGMGEPGASLPTEMTLVVNSGAPLIAKLAEYTENNTDKAEKMAAYIYKLSLLSQKKLSAEEMQSFLADGFDILLML
ncbi:MAG: molecular chaperone HtpG [Clostridia bacterium]|nr:molecular chaperone HtpG [Clostridia bacterium]